MQEHGGNERDELLMALQQQRLLLSSAEAARELGCSDETIRRMARDGTLHAERRGRNFRIPRREIERLTGHAPEQDDADTERKALIRQLREIMAQAAVVLAKLES